MDKSEIGDKSNDFYKFLTNLCGEFKEKCDTEDQIPLRHPNPRITPPELEGECLDWCLDYLSTRGCPSVFTGLITREVYKRVCDTDLKPFLTEDTWKDSPRIEGEADINDDSTGNKTQKQEDIEYDAEKLQKHVVGELEAVCLAWLKSFPEFHMAGKHPTVSFHAIKNTRRKMEDRHVMVQDLNSLFGIRDQPPQAFYGVFDGHAGTEAATFASKHIHCNLVRQCGLEKNPGQACKSAFKVTDDMYIPKAKKERWRSGSTGVTALIRPNTIYLSWLGDSQAVLVRNGKAVTVMEPHKPDRQDEQERIKSQGGFVMRVGDLWRVGGNLAVSRAIGDIQYKPFVCSDAEVIEHKLDGTEEYLVLACDGLWDAVEPVDLPRVIFDYMAESGGDAAGIAKYLTQYAKDHESMDNISVIVLFFRENLVEPVVDTGLFSFLGGGKGSDTNTDNNSQGDSDNSGQRSDNSNNKNSGANSYDQELEGKGNNSGESGNSHGQGKDNSCSNSSEKAVSENYEKEEGRSSRSFSEQKNQQNDQLNSQEREPSGSSELQKTQSKPEFLVNINHMSFEIIPSINQSNQPTISDSQSTSFDVSESFDHGSSIHDNDLDSYGVFNSKLLDGQVDLNEIVDSNSSNLIRDIANEVYNKENNDLQMHVISFLHRPSKGNLKMKQGIGNNLQTFLNTRSYPNVKRSKRSKLHGKKSKRESGGSKRNLKSPVRWAFTGMNRATVKNYKLDMAAKIFNRGTSEPIPTVKPLPSKFAQVYSSTENIHDIPNMTMSHGKLQSLPFPRPQVLPESLAELSRSKVFGSKSGSMKDMQKFHTTWRPRKPLKPISTVMYETPPTPFANSKLQGSKQEKSLAE